MANNTTTIRISNLAKLILDKNKVHPRETYDDLIKRVFKKRR